MAKGLYARHYAQAVFQIALEQKALDRWQSDLDKIDEIARTELLHTFLDSTKIPFEDKVKILSEQLKGVNPLALNLVYLLISRDQVRLLPEIVDEYRRITNRYYGIAQADVTTAVDIDEAEKKRIVEYLERVTGKKVTPRFAVNPKLIGGLVARIDGKLLDGSTRSKLELLKKQLVGAGS